MLFPLLAVERPVYRFAFQNPDLPLSRRLDDLVGRMTLAEKVSQMTHQAAAIPRLGIPTYNWWNEGLHGVARNGIATVFPQAIGLGATWDAPLIRKVADAISTEARAKHHEDARHGRRGIYQGLTFWSPNINIFRDPRWGRGQETYGEDPYLTGTLAVQFVKGLQGDDPKYLKVVATPKHFAVHSGPESLRHQFDVSPSAQDLWSTYLPQFERAIVDGHAWSVMGAYNRVFGVPANASTFLLDDVLRKKWSFPGYVVSDCGAIDDIYLGHHFAKTKVEAVAKAVTAGCDIECGSCYESLVQAVHQGLVSESTVDRSVRRLMEARLRLGMFDPPERVPYARIPYSEVNSPAHQKLALKAAEESMVLLKNDRQTLPLGPKVRRTALIGPLADNVPVLLGNYNGDPRAPITLLAGMRQVAKAHGADLLYAPGSGITEDESASIPGAALLSEREMVGGLTAEYYANPRLEGTPVLRRQEVPAFDWGESSPAQGVPNHNFSVRWTGFLVAPRSGEYQVGFTHDDGVRVWLDGKLVVDDWTENAPRRHSTHIALSAGQRLPIRIEFFQRGGGAVAKLDWSPPDPSRHAAALRLAQSADVVVMALGITGELEGEEADRSDLALPGVQQRLLEEVVALGKPVVLVLQSGSPMAVGWAKQYVPAILQAWYPGESGGLAIARTLFGDNNPGGRLPVTFYASLGQLPPFTDYNMDGRTYRYLRQTPLFRFGDGLSYTTFRYSGIRVKPLKGGLSVTATVRNTGERSGDEVAQVYVSHEHAPFRSPIRELKGYRRITLAAGESRIVEFRLSTDDLKLVDPKGKRVAVSGPLRIDLGGHQPGGGTLTAYVR